MPQTNEPWIFDQPVIFRSTVSLPVGSVGDAQGSAGSPMGPSKLKHQHCIDKEQVGTAVAAVIHLHRVKGLTSTNLTLSAGFSEAACIGNATVTIDIKKNGVSILSASTVLDSTNALYAEEAFNITDDDAVAGDNYTAHITVNAGTGTLGKGLFISGRIDEDYT